MSARIAGFCTVASASREWSGMWCRPIRNGTCLPRNPTRRAQSGSTRRSCPGLVRPSGIKTTTGWATRSYLGEPGNSAWIQEYALSAGSDLTPSRATSTRASAGISCARSRGCEAADSGELYSPDAPFELPQFPGAAELGVLVAFSEGEASLPTWAGIPERYGTLELYRLRENPELLVVREYRTSGKALPTSPQWGQHITATSARAKGIWLRLDCVPVAEPWQAPATWGELRQAARSQGIDLNSLLRPLLAGLRDEEEHIALVGFPIPETFGGTGSRMHWQAMRLPILSQREMVPDGFRWNETGFRERDRRGVLASDAPLKWLASENWHEDQIATRGRMAASVRKKRILVVGTGALGAALSEILDRSGNYSLTVLDGDYLSAGNLVRHILGMDDLGLPKVHGVSQRLNAASPHAAAVAIREMFPPRSEVDQAHVRDCEVVLDCTGEDEVLRQMEVFDWGGQKCFLSVSLGREAKRLYGFNAVGECFPYDAFQQLVQPWLRREAEEYEGQEWPREGIGCWHPVFPAGIDDVWMMASAAAKYVEEVLVAGAEHSQLTVYEREEDGAGRFLGLRRFDRDEQ